MENFHCRKPRICAADQAVVCSLFVLNQYQNIFQHINVLENVLLVVQLEQVILAYDFRLG